MTPCTWLTYELITTVTVTNVIGFEGDLDNFMKNKAINLKDSVLPLSWESHVVKYQFQQKTARYVCSFCLFDPKRLVWTIIYAQDKANCCFKLYK